MNARLVPAAELNADVSDKEKMVTTLRELLRETFRLRNQGAAYAKLTHSQGYADGYMRLMTDSGVVTHQELLEIIRDVRRGVDGPATARISVDVAATA